MEILEKIIRPVNTFGIDFLLSNPIGRKVVEQLAEAYIAGHSVEQGLEAVLNYHQRGRYSTIDFLGEEATTAEQADHQILLYQNIIERINQEGLNEFVSISVKPSAICAIDPKTQLILPETPLIERLEKSILNQTHNRNIKVTLDMEDHNWTDISLQTAEKIWNDGYDNFGIVLQSRLNRTEKDIENIFKFPSYELSKKYFRVRACIGIYLENKSIATTSKQEAKARLVKRVQELFDAGIYVEIATHDHKVIHTIINDIIKPQGIPATRFEFQFLKGVQNAYNIENYLMKQGYTIRYYMPVEENKGDGNAYMERRLKANPWMTIAGAENFLKMWLKFGKNIN